MEMMESKLISFSGFDEPTNQPSAGWLQIQTPGLSFFNFFYFSEWIIKNMEREPKPIKLLLK